MKGMFQYTRSFNQYIGNWHVSKLVDTRGMFYETDDMLHRYPKLNNSKLSSYNWKSVLTNDDDRLKIEQDKACFARKMILRQQYTDDENINVFQHPVIQEAIANYIDKRGYLF